MDRHIRRCREKSFLTSQDNSFDFIQQHEPEPEPEITIIDFVPHSKVELTPLPAVYNPMNCESLEIQQKETQQSERCWTIEHSQDWFDWGEIYPHEDPIQPWGGKIDSLEYYSTRPWSGKIDSLEYYSTRPGGGTKYSSKDHPMEWPVFKIDEADFMKTLLDAAALCDTLTARIWEKNKETVIEWSQVFHNMIKEFRLTKQLFRNNYKEHLQYISKNNEQLARLLLNWMKKRYFWDLYKYSSWSYCFKEREKILKDMYKSVCLCFLNKEDLQWDQVFIMKEDSKLFMIWRNVVTQILAVFATLIKWTTDQLITCSYKEHSKRVVEVLILDHMTLGVNDDQNETSTNVSCGKMISEIYGNKWNKWRKCSKEILCIMDVYKDPTRINSALFFQNRDFEDASILVFAYLIHILQVY